MSLATDAGPNLYAALIALIQMLGTAFAVYIGYLGTRNTLNRTDNKLDTKLDKVHETVNGNLSRAQERAEKYAKILRDNGIDPDKEI